MIQPIPLSINYSFISIFPTVSKWTVGNNSENDKTVKCSKTGSKNFRICRLITGETNKID